MEVKNVYVQDDLFIKAAPVFSIIMFLMVWTDKTHVSKHFRNKKIGQSNEI